MRSWLVICAVCSMHIDAAHPFGDGDGVDAIAVAERVRSVDVHRADGADHEPGPHGVRVGARRAGAEGAAIRGCASIFAALRSIDATAATAAQAIRSRR